MIELIISTVVSAGVQIDLPPPTVMKPLELWTGKQLFGLLVRPNAATR